MRSTSSPTFGRTLANGLLALIVAASLAWPAAAFANPAIAFADPTEADAGIHVDPTTSASSEANDSDGSGESQQPAGSTDFEDQSSADDQADSLQELTISGLKTSFTKTPRQTVKDTIKVSPAAKHRVLLQWYDDEWEEWVTKAKFTTKANGKVTITYPATWRKHNSSTWRLVIKATATNSRSVSDTINIVAKNRSTVNLKAKSAVIVDAKTGATYFSKKENVKRQNASTTKMMTTLLALENNKLDDLVPIPAQAANTPYSNLGAKSIGDTITLKNLLHMALLLSDNGAAEALGLYTGGTEKKFVSMMNKRAKELGCTNTSFKNPHGLTQKGHGTTAHDLALIAREALNNPTFKKIVGKKSYSFRSTSGIPYTVKTTNKLLGKVKGVHGVKTGYTDAAGHCFVGAFKYKGRTYLTVVLGSPTSDQRWNDTKALIRYIKKWF